MGRQPCTVTLDPPWPEKGGGEIKRGADRWYPTIGRKEDILKVVLQSGAWPQWSKSDSAHCYMWVTNNYLAWGLWLMEALGFEYKTNLVWVKTIETWPRVLNHFIDDELGLALDQESWSGILGNMVRIGLGRYFRGSHELCLFGTRGPAAVPEKALPSVFLAPRVRDEAGAEIHSRKPAEFFEIVEATSPGPYREFFARKSGRKRWSYWGNEV